MKWNDGDLVHGFRVSRMSHIEEVNADAYLMEQSCSSSKNTQNENATKAEKITEAEAARPSADEEMDESYLILSEAQQNIVKKNNDFAFKIYQNERKSFLYLFPHDAG